MAVVVVELSWWGKDDRRRDPNVTLRFYCEGPFVENFPWRPCTVLSPQKVKKKLHGLLGPRRDAFVAKPPLPAQLRVWAPCEASLEAHDPCHAVPAVSRRPEPGDEEDKVSETERDPEPQQQPCVGHLLV